MQTNCIRNSDVGDEWIKQVCAANPVQYVHDKDNNVIGMLTGPVRLSWVNLFKLPEKKAGNDSEPKFGTTFLWTPYTDLSLMNQAYYGAVAEKFPEYRNPADGTYPSLHNPFHDQGEKARYDGYTPGCIYAASTTQFRMPVVDVRHNPIVDENAVYPGAWAICSVNFFPYGKSPPRPKKGIGMGLLTVMKIADDVNLSAGGQADPTEQFKNVRVQPPSVSPSTYFTPSQVGAHAAPAIPPMVGAGGFAPPPMQPPAAPSGDTPEMAEMRAAGLL